MVGEVETSCILEGGGKKMAVVSAKENLGEATRARVDKSVGSGSSSSSSNRRDRLSANVEGGR